MFAGNSKNSLFNKFINVTYLSEEFEDKLEDLMTHGTFIEIKPKRIINQIDKEALTNEELQYFEKQ